MKKLMLFELASFGLSESRKQPTALAGNGLVGSWEWGPMSTVQALFAP
jgi:hypothetical protein